MPPVIVRVQRQIHRSLFPLHQITRTILYPAGNFHSCLWVGKVRRNGLHGMINWVPRVFRGVNFGFTHSPRPRDWPVMPCDDSSNQLFDS